MPNWCDTTYKAVGTKEQVKQFYNLAMQAWKERSKKHPNAYEGWLGAFVDILDGPEEAYGRGWMRAEPYLRDDFKDDYAECTIYCDTAWGEPNQWREFIESKIDGLKLLYVAIEPGCGVYISNDDAYENMYYVDASPDQPDEPFMTEDEVCDFIRDHFGEGEDVRNIDDCLAFAKEYNDKNEDEWLYINEIEMCNY